MKVKIKYELIEKFMQKNNLSNTAFCKLCKISPATFKKIKNNQINYRINALFKIAKTLNVNISQMFE